MLTSLLNLVSIAALTISNTRGRPLLTVTPTTFPAIRLVAKKHTGDLTTSLADFVQVRCFRIHKRLLEDLTDNLHRIQIRQQIRAVHYFYYI
jgi:hypothetical protein